MYVHPSEIIIVPQYDDFTHKFIKIPFTFDGLRERQTVDLFMPVNHPAMLDFSGGICYTYRISSRKECYVMGKLYESGENYLETILILSQNGADVRSIDIAHEMEVSKPSVSRAVGILRDNQFIVVDKDGYITLTDTGREIAERIYERHQVLTQWLVDIGVPADVAAEDACKLEHDISTVSFEALKTHIRKAHPGILTSPESA